MNCYHCKEKLIWGGDNSFDECGLDGDGVVSCLSCPSCDSFVVVHCPIGEEDETKTN